MATPDFFVTSLTELAEGLATLGLLAFMLAIGYLVAVIVFVATKDPHGRWETSLQCGIVALIFSFVFFGASALCV